MPLNQLLIVRLARSAVLSCLTVLVGYWAHVHAGGHPVNIGLGASFAALGTSALYPLTRRRWNFGHVLAFMGVAQTLIHAAMNLGAGGGHHPAALADSVTPAMMTSHVLATVIMAALIAIAEKALAWAVRRWLRPQTRSWGEFLPQRGNGFVVAVAANQVRVIRGWANRAPPRSVFFSA